MVVFVIEKYDSDLLGVLSKQINKHADGMQRMCMKHERCSYCDEGSRLDLIVRILRGVAHLHVHDVVHRDLKVRAGEGGGACVQE